jgi:hypothetical protein
MTARCASTLDGAMTMAGADPVFAKWKDERVQHCFLAELYLGCGFNFQKLAKERRETGKAVEANLPEAYSNVVKTAEAFQDAMCKGIRLTDGQRIWGERVMEFWWKAVPIQ